MPCAHSKTVRTSSATAAALRLSSSFRVLLILGLPPLRKRGLALEPGANCWGHFRSVFMAERDLECFRFDNERPGAVVAYSLKTAVFLLNDVVDPLRVAVAYCTESVWCLAHSATPYTSSAVGPQHSPSYRDKCFLWQSGHRLVLDTRPQPTQRLASGGSTGPRSGASCSTFCGRWLAILSHNLLILRETLLRLRPS